MLKTNSCLCELLGGMFLLPFISCTSGTKSASEIKSLSALQVLLEDYHRCYGEYLGKQHYDGPMEMSICFYEKDSLPFVALMGVDRSGYLWDNPLFTSSSGYFRKDMLGYCLYEGDGLCIYNSVGEEYKAYVEPYLQNLSFDKDTVNEILQRRLESDCGVDLYHFTCVYQLDSCSNFSLADSSGNFYNLKYTDFMFYDY